MNELMSEKSLNKYLENSYGFDESEKRQLNQIIKNMFENKNFDWPKSIQKKINEEGVLKSILEYVKEIILETKEYQESIIKGNIKPIMRISSKIVDNNPKPEIYFILFKAVFTLYKSDLEQKNIINFTHEVINFISKLKNKDQVVLSNFNDLFEILIFLKVNQIKEYSEIDELLKESLKSKDNVWDRNYVKFFCDLVNQKINSQQFVIFSLLVEYITEFSNVQNCDKLLLFHGILQPIFKLQMDKNNDVVENAEKCYRKILNDIDIEKNFKLYYKFNLELMDNIFEIAIEESYPKMNKINKNSWALLIIFFKNWQYFNRKIASPQILKADISLKKRTSTASFKIHDKSSKRDNRSPPRIYNLKTSTIQSDDNNYIPFKLFDKAISLIIKTYESGIDIPKVIKDPSKKIIEIINNNEDNNFKLKTVTSTILSAMQNKKISQKNNLVKWVEFLFYIYHKGSSNDFNSFIEQYIECIPKYNADDFIIFEEIVLKYKSWKIDEVNANIKILKELIEKIISKNELINNEKVYNSILDVLLKKFNYDILMELEILAEVLEQITNKIFIEKMVIAITDYILTDNIKIFINSFARIDIEKKNHLFLKLYSIWSINPLSLLLFCIITEKFELAFNIILNFKKVKLGNDIYKMLGKFVGYFAEKENYDFLRLKLLEPKDNIFFIKTLFGILMILPQGVAFDYLSEKLSSVQTLLSIEGDIDKDEMTKKIEKNKNEINKYINIILNKQKNSDAENIKNKISM